MSETEQGDRVPSTTAGAGPSRRRWLALGLVAAVVVGGAVVAEVTAGLVTRVVQATGLTCGGVAERVDADELEDLRVLRWGTPEAAERGDPEADLTDLPPVLAEPSLTTAFVSEVGDYDPRLMGLNGGTVLQVDGYVGQRWVVADAEDGEPLWGVSADETGYALPNGVLTLVAARSEHRTDLTTYATDSGAELGCIRVPGELLQVAGAAGRGVVVTARGEDGVVVQRRDPLDGDVRWEVPLAFSPSELRVEHGLVLASSATVQRVDETWDDGFRSEVVALDLETGEQLWEHRVEGGHTAVVDAVMLPDGSPGTLVLDVADRAMWDADEAERVLLGADGDPIWRVPVARRTVLDAAWVVGDVLAVADDYRLTGLDLPTGETIWASEAQVGQATDGAQLPQEPDRLILTDQREAVGDHDAVFTTVVVDLRTGDLERWDAPLRSAELEDGYLLTSTGLVQLVIPLAE